MTRRATGRGALLALVLTLGLGGLGALAGCGTDEAPDDDSTVDDLVQRMDATIGGPLHDAADAGGIAFTSGTRRMTICGEDYAPVGVSVGNIMKFQAPADLPDEEALRAIGDVLTGDGWQVEQPTGERLDATKDDLTLSVQAGVAYVVNLDGECAETSEEVAKSHDERPSEKIVWDR
ncbi:hypothetical protein JK386_06510 [Nocardioides sp. zg-536]|uniref:Uncharacterized protein n=1 Tax=Nocardioides faecalis TaxID=2803858 RepID=A0A938Y7D6_9ACTN|nr:hypothetical protein [Nocardioides faecalis]MBM9459548.1 hypothetical protein [Nocardioides faecalis]QVI58080.1 hypothetical protein KG111_13805 [Nocardioides faecalis]